MADFTSGTSLRGWSQLQSASFGGAAGLNFPSPFLDFESTKVPASIKELYEVALHAFLTDSNINPVIENISSYPITEIVVDEGSGEADHEISNKWVEIINEHLDLRNFNIQVGYDYMLYGTAFVSVYCPFVRSFVCGKCGLEHNSKIKSTKWKWKSLKFWVECHKCQSIEEAKIKDEPSDDIEDVSLLRWSPYNIDIEVNPFNNKKKMWYNIPAAVKAKILGGTDPSFLLETPKEVIEAIVNSERGRGPARFKFKPDQIFTMSRPIPSMPGNSLENSGWGLPLVTSSLRDYFFKNIMRRAQAMVLYEHIIPFRVFSPSFVEGNSSLVPLATWQKEVMTNYLKWRKNPMHIMTSPIPLNVQQIGGGGKALTLFAEIQMTDNNIIKGMNVPRELVEGGLTYSGSSVSLRMLENILMDYVHRSERLVNWIMKKVSDIIHLKYIKAHYLPFKMADDIQLKGLLVNMAQSEMVSNEFVGNVFEFDSQEQQKIIEKEKINKAKMAARANGEAQNVANKINEYYSLSNVPSYGGNMDNPIPPEQSGALTDQLSAMGPEQAQAQLQQLDKSNPMLAKNLNNRAQLSPLDAAREMSQLSTLPPEMQELAVEDLKNRDPQRYLIMKTLFPDIATNKNPSPNGGVNMKPMPSQKPPTGAKTNY